MNEFKMPGASAGSAGPKVSAPKIHPAAAYNLKVRMPDSRGAGRAPSPMRPMGKY